MFYYPFSNVFDDGRICLGHNSLPIYQQAHKSVSLPGYLLSIPNNFDMFSAERNRLKLGYRDLMEHLKDKAPAYYYEKVLVPNGKTLADFIGRG